MARKNEICYVNFYTVGSAAYQVNSSQRKKPVKLDVMACAVRSPVAGVG